MSNYFDSWNKRLGSKRNYDYEPVKVRLFSGIYWPLGWFPMYFMFCIFFVIDPILKRYFSINLSKDITNNPKKYAEFLSQPLYKPGDIEFYLYCLLFLFIIFFLIPVLYDLFRNDTEVYLMENSIRIYEYGEITEEHNISNVGDEKFSIAFGYVGSDEIGKPQKQLKSKLTLAMPFIVGIPMVPDSAIPILIYLYLGNIITKFLLFLFINKKISYFSLFPHFTYYIGYPYDYYFDVFIYNKEVYNELRQYFLDKRNIDIKNIKKDYFFV